MGQTLMRSNFIIVLEQCVNDFSDFIEKSIYDDKPSKCVLKAMMCRNAFLECIDACESGEVINRGQLMYSCKVLCSEFLENCISQDNPISLKCAASCSRYIQECDNVLTE